MNITGVGDKRFFQGFTPAWRDDHILQNLDLSDHSKYSRMFRIAILCPAVCPLIDQVYKGFVDTLKQQSPLSFEFVSYNAKKDPVRMRELIDHILIEEFDLVLSMGVMCTLLAKQVTMQKRRKIPIVFCSLLDPVGHHIVESVTRSGCHVTGVAGGVTIHSQQVKLLKAFKPEMKQLMVVYNPMRQAGHLKGCFAEVAYGLRKDDITLVERHVFQESQVLKAIETDIEACDALLLFRDQTVLPRIDDLVAMCNAYGITLMTSDWYTVGRGAAMGFSASDYVSGAAAASKVRLVLEGEYSPCDVPVTSPDYEYKLKLNERAFDKQSLNIDEKILRLIRSVHVV